MGFTATALGTTNRNTMPPDMQWREAWRCSRAELSADHLPFQFISFVSAQMSAYCSVSTRTAADPPKDGKALDAVGAREELKAAECLQPPGAACQQCLHIPLK